MKPNLVFTIIDSNHNTAPWPSSHCLSSIFHLLHAPPAHRLLMNVPKAPFLMTIDEFYMERWVCSDSAQSSMEDVGVPR